MILRLISLIVFGLALSSCSDGGFNGRTQEFSGVWLYEFEGSIFVEGAAAIPDKPLPPERADWFEWRDQPRLEALINDHPGRGGGCHAVLPILVTFIGHRTHYPFGGTGHLGMWRSKMTVQRTISAKRLGPSFCYDL